MLEHISLKNFKCFETLSLPLAPLTLLSGTNASGKSSVIHSLILLHQTIRENEYAQRLILNGNTVQLGTRTDVVNQIHGRDSFSIGLVSEDESIKWVFAGERDDMSLGIAQVEALGETISEPDDMRNLVPVRALTRRLVEREEGVTQDEPDYNRLRVRSSVRASGPFRSTEKIRDLTYLTAEREGPRDLYPLEDQHFVDRVGPRGENAVSALFSGRDSEVPEPLVLKEAVPTLLRQVEARLSQFFPGCSLNVQPIPNVNALTLGIRIFGATNYLRPIHCGFGVTQILPIIIAALYISDDEDRSRFRVRFRRRRSDILIIENPEVHLHPAGQALMGQFLAEVANSGRQVIVETHSDHILNGIRRAVKSHDMPAESVAIYFFKQTMSGQPDVFAPILGDDGSIDEWPEGFFDQFDKDIDFFAGWGE